MVPPIKGEMGLTLQGFDVGTGFSLLGYKQATKNFLLQPVSGKGERSVCSCPCVCLAEMKGCMLKGSVGL